jgi:hypothetical protein
LRAAEEQEPTLEERQVSHMEAHMKLRTAHTAVETAQIHQELITAIRTPLRIRVEAVEDKRDMVVIQAQVARVL